MTLNEIRLGIVRLSVERVRMVRMLRKAPIEVEGVERPNHVVRVRNTALEQLIRGVMAEREISYQKAFEQVINDIFINSEGGA